MGKVEYNIIHAVQIIDGCIVALIPFLKWLAVAGLYAAAAALAHWNIKRS